MYSHCKNIYSSTFNTFVAFLPISFNLPEASGRQRFRCESSRMNESAGLDSQHEGRGFAGAVYEAIVLVPDIFQLTTILNIVQLFNKISKHGSKMFFFC